MRKTQLAAYIELGRTIPESRVTAGNFIEKTTVLRHKGVVTYVELGRTTPESRVTAGNFIGKTAVLRPDGVVTYVELGRKRRFLHKI